MARAPQCPALRFARTNGQAGHGTHAVQGRRWPKLKGDRLEWPVDHRLVVLERTDAHGSSSFALAVRNHCPPWRSRVSAGSPCGVRVHLMAHPRASRPHARGACAILIRVRRTHTRRSAPSALRSRGGRALSQEVHASFGSIGAAGGTGRCRLRCLSVGRRLCFTLPPEEPGSEPCVMDSAATRWRFAHPSPQTGRVRGLHRRTDGR